jgi:MFS family permease
MIGITYSTFSFAFILLTPFGGRLADSGRRWAKILFGNIAIAITIAMYGVIQWIPGILVLGMLEGGIATIPTPALDAYLASVADPRIQGRVQGAFSTIGTCGAASAALFGVWLYDIAQFLPFFAAGAILITLTLIAIPLVRAAEATARETHAPLVVAGAVE